MKKILFILLIITLSGCISTRKTVKENVKLDTVENVDRTEGVTENKSSSTDTTKEVKTNVTDKSVTRTTETEYSKPDESGNQHKIRETVTETKNDIAILNEENERIISEQNQKIERLTSDNSTLRTQLEASHQETTKTSTRMPVWTYIVAFTAGAGLSLIIRSWLKGIFNR